jgi:hypothetical protein
VPAGPFDLECILDTFEPGPFTYQLTLYVDDAGLRKISFIIQGQAQASRGTT